MSVLEILLLSLALAGCAVTVYHAWLSGSARHARIEQRMRSSEQFALRRALWIAGSEVLRARNCRTSIREGRLDRTLNEVEVLQRRVATLVELMRPWSHAAIVADVTGELGAVGSQLVNLERAANGDLNGFQAVEINRSLTRLEKLLSDWAARMTTGPPRE